MLENIKYAIGRTVAKLVALVTGLWAAAKAYVSHILEK